MTETMAMIMTTMTETIAMIMTMMTMMTTTMKTETMVMMMTTTMTTTTKTETMTTTDPFYNSTRSPNSGALASNPSVRRSSAKAPHRSPWFTSTRASR